MKYSYLLLIAGSAIGSACGEKNLTGTPPPVIPPVTTEVNYYITKADQSALLTKQAVPLVFGTEANQHSTIIVDTSQQFQQMDGFGYTFTGGSAELINALPPAVKTALLQELFGMTDNSIGVSYLRVSIGASDLSSKVFTYDDIPAGQTDPTLQHFSLSEDTLHLIPLLKQVVAINPMIRIMGSPWTPPLWMKSNNNSIGGKLKPEYYDAYAKYFVKYIQAMKSHGIVIDAITPQNEPLHPLNNPSLDMTAAEQKEFIKNHLGPAFESSGIETKIIIYDHNADRPDYPLEILADAGAKKYVNGSAFHLYGGDISALTQVHNAHPDKHIYFTEQYTASNGTFGGDLGWHLKNLIIGAPRNWSRNVLEWNLANDASFGPHTPGGCTTCKGALTINAANITRNVAYYIIAHASKFIPAGSVRIQSNIPGSLQNVAFIRPDKRKVLIVLNDAATLQQFNIRFSDKWVLTSLEGGSVGTYIF
jgi:glucosylceramidase